MRLLLAALLALSACAPYTRSECDQMCARHELAMTYFICDQWGCLCSCDDG